MSVQSEINRITSNIEDTYDVLESTGIVMPAVENTDNLASTVTSLANTKQDTLVSGTNIKTINGSTILGSGDLSVGGSEYSLGAGATSNIVTLSKDGTVQDTITIDNVANADSATTDSDGNTISTTFVKKSGDTMTGTLTGTDIVENNITVNQQINQGEFH